MLLIVECRIVLYGFIVQHYQLLNDLVLRISLQRLFILSDGNEQVIDIQLFVLALIYFALKDFPLLFIVLID
jgi:hypothetical protein